MTPVFSLRFQKRLGKLPQGVQRRIIGTIERFIETGQPHPEALKGKAAGLHKLKVGDYRVILQVVEATLVVLDVGDRKDVYRGY